MAQLLNDADVQQQLSQLPSWDLVGQEIRCIRKFKDFIEAIEFVNRLVEPAEAVAHHPDISISYNQVSIALTTHDAGGLTQKDFDLAKIISAL